MRKLQIGNHWGRNGGRLNMAIEEGEGTDSLHGWAAKTSISFGNKKPKHSIFSSGYKYTSISITIYFYVCYLSEYALM
jgi:hypothetical protein